MHVTTIRVDEEIKKQLDMLKVHPKESYNEVISRLIVANTDDEPLSEEELQGIEESLRDIRAGRVYTLEEVRDEIEGTNGRLPGNSHRTGKKGHEETTA